MQAGIYKVWCCFIHRLVWCEGLYVGDDSYCNIQLWSLMSPWISYYQLALAHSRSVMYFLGMHQYTNYRRNTNTPQTLNVRSSVFDTLVNVWKTLCLARPWSAEWLLKVKRAAQYRCYVRLSRLLLATLMHWKDWGAVTVLLQGINCSFIGVWNQLSSHSQPNALL